MLEEVAERLQDNYPYFHPLYAGQMLKPPHPVARLAYALAMWINPNNHALDGGRASSAHGEGGGRRDRRACSAGRTHLGHLCGGGTMANLEALWVAGQLRPGAAVVASEQAHYTHARIGAVLGLPFERSPATGAAAWTSRRSRAPARAGGVGTVVATIGTTATGSVDPLPEMLRCASATASALHADAAYGGYFGLADNLARRGAARLRPPRRGGLDRHRPAQARPAALRLRLRALPRSVRRPLLQARLAVHVLQLATSCTWARSASSARAPGAAAVALWATQRLLPLEARRRVRARARGLPRGGARRSTRRSRPTPASCRRFRPSSTSSSGSAGARARRQRLGPRAPDLRGGRAPQPPPRARRAPGGVLRPRGAPGSPATRDTVTCLRSVLMKPEHREWTSRILAILGEAADASA